MSNWSAPEIEATSSPLVRGEVIEGADRRYRVHLADRDGDLVLYADVLSVGAEPLVLHAGDSVLCWRERPDATRAVIVGRIGPAVIAPLASKLPQADMMDTDGVPETLVLEARHSLTLRVGEGSITIREDGKILIKGKDLISHAQRMNRIKGGSVAIN
jgi:hypothetical protein